MKHLRVALVHMNKPHDVAIALQLAMAFPDLEVFSIGTTLDPGHKKIHDKVASWTVDMGKNVAKWERVASLDELSSRGFNLVSTSPRDGTNLFAYEVADNDVFVLGGAAGLSKENLAKCHSAITIPCDPSVPFLTVGSVIPLLIGHTFRA